MNVRDSVQRICGGLIFFTSIVGFTVTAVFAAMGVDTTLVFSVGGAAAAVVLASSLVLWKYHHQPDIAPDFLARLCRGSYIDAGGLCFVVIPATAKGYLEMHIYYQNRY